MNVAIRESNPGDLHALSTLASQTYAAAFGHSMTAGDLAAHLRNHLSLGQIAEMLATDVFLLACIADNIIGFAQFGTANIELEHLVKTAPFTVAPGAKEIRRLYVLAPYQNRGLGSQLMAAALTHPQLMTSANIFLDVWQDNERAQRFYQRYGFEKVAEKRFYVESGDATGVDFVMIRRSHY